MDAYRRDQAALGGRIAASASQIVANGLDPSDPDRGWARLLAELLALLRGGRDLSEDLAMEFYRYLRELEDAADTPPPEEPDVPFPTDAVVGSLIWTGPRMAKAMIRRGDDRNVSARVGTMVGRSAMRHTLNAGRETTRRLVVNDPAAWGWARITDADPCEFCKMLATRGPVYKTARTAGNELNRYHDGCGCSVVAVFKG
ncbi:hypothetical protein SMC26_39410 [Actinomadura fulvescens]